MLFFSTQLAVVWSHGLEYGSFIARAYSFQVLLGGKGMVLFYGSTSSVQQCLSWILRTARPNGSIWGPQARTDTFWHAYQYAKTMVFL